MKHIVNLNAYWCSVMELFHYTNMHSFVVMELNDILNFQKFHVIIIISIVFWNYTTHIWSTFNLYIASIWHVYDQHMACLWLLESRFEPWFYGDNCLCNQLPFNIMIKCVKDYIYYDYI
jgi:hypothetical protein